MTLTSRLAVPAPLRLTAQALAVLGAMAMLAFSIQLAAAAVGNVTIAKSSNAVEPVAGNVSYTYTITADVGALPVTEFEIDDGTFDFPQISVDTATYSVDGVGSTSCAPSASDVTCTIGAVPADTQVVVTIGVTTDPDVQVRCTDPETPGVIDTTAINRADVSWRDADNPAPAAPFTVQSNAESVTLNCTGWTPPVAPPNTTIATGPAEGSSTTSTSASFTFSGTNTPTSFDCKLDAGAFAVCTSPKSYTSLAVGSHTFSVRGVNAGGPDATPATRTWTITGTTPPPTGHPFTDINGHPFEGDIAWLFNEGITGGCTATKFCPNSNVTRDQMASLLDRALDLPTTSTDFFTDDEGNIHEAAINRLAAAGITGGCASGRYCPKAAVKRDQMASFLVRAFKLPPSAIDPFTDDEGNQHENQINALAASGITSGCGLGRYCPNNLVSRGQMAAFLHRAVD